MMMMSFTAYFINTVTYKKKKSSFIVCKILPNKIKELLALAQPKGYMTEL